jgi:hypothetical protein
LSWRPPWRAPANRPDISRVRGWTRPVPTGALRQLHGSDGVNIPQLVVTPICPIGGGWRWDVQGLDHNGLGLTPLVASGGRRSLGIDLGGGEVHH